MHIEPDVFRAVTKLETLGLRDNDLDCLPIEELSYLRTLRAVRIDGNPWLCECRQRLDKYFRDRSIIQEVQCSTKIHLCRKYQCMTPIGFPRLPPSFTTQVTVDTHLSTYLDCNGWNYVFRNAQRSAPTNFRRTCSDPWTDFRTKQHGSRFPV